LVDSGGDLLFDENGRLGKIRGEHVTAVAVPHPNGSVLIGRADGDVEYLGVKALLARTGAPVLGLATGGDRILVRTAKQLRAYTFQGALVSTIRTAAQHATISPGGLGVATAEGKVAQLWDATTGKLLHTLVGHTSAITDVAYAPNGLDLVTVSIDHRGLVWSARSGRRIHQLIGHFFPVYAGNYSPDGHWIVTASQFKAGLWNAATGQFMFYLGGLARPPLAPLTSVSFSPRGYWILTGSRDGTARIYRCQICEPLPRLEAIARQRLSSLSG